MECVVLLTNATDMQPILIFPINACMNQVWVLFVMSPRADFQNCCLDFFFFFKGHFFLCFWKVGPQRKQVMDFIHCQRQAEGTCHWQKKKNVNVNWYKRGIFTKYNLYHVATLSQWSRDDSRMCYSAAVPVEVWRPRPLSPESFKMTIRRKRETHSFCCLRVVSPSLLLRGSQWVVYRNVCIRTFHQHNNADIPSISFLFLLGSVSNHGCQLGLLLLPWTSA